MMRTILISLCLVFFLFGCKDSKISHDNKNTAFINASDKSIKNESFKEILVFDSFLSLKGINAEDFIVLIDKVIYYENNYYVLDKQKSNLFVFDITGNMVKKIGSRGMGPGEFSNISDFNIDKKRNIINILSGNDVSINKYNLDGTFIERIRFDSFYPKSFALLNNSYFAFDTGYDNEFNKNVIITDLKGRIVKKLFGYPKDLLPISFGYTGGIIGLDGNALYSDATSPLIYSFDEDFIPYERYKFDFGEKTWQEKDRYNYQLFEAKNELFETSFLTNEYIENENVLVFNYIDGNKIKRGYYFFDNEQTITYDNISDKDLLSFFKTPVGFKDKHFVSYIDSEIYFNLKDFHPDLDNKLNGVNSELAKQVKKFNENSSPLLLIYDIKD